MTGERGRKIMMDYTELFVLLWLLPVITQIIIPLVMLLVYLLVKAGNVVMISIFAKGATDRHQDLPGLMVNNTANPEV
jgi:hypothetical protein